MARYLLRRFLWSIPVLIAVSLATFMLMHIIPGNPCGDGGKAIPPETQAQLDHLWKLDRPLPVQYIEYMLGAIHGDLGPSYCDTRTVNRIIADHLPVIAAFGAAALLIGTAIGVPVGVVLALRRNSLIDRIITLIMTVNVSVPNLIIAIVLILIFIVNLHLFPYLFRPDKWQSWILPLALLAFRVLALVLRLTRATTLDTLGEDYIRTAHMKGLPPSLIVLRHILRNTLLPVVTLLGPLAADLLTGVFIVEAMFSIPGLGWTFVGSISARDYPLLMGVTLFFAVTLIFFNLLVDLSYAVIDPRIARS